MIPLPLQHRRSFILLLCLTLVALADSFLYEHVPGWTLAILFGVAAAAVTLRTPALWRCTAGRIVVALTAIILFALVEEPSPLAILMSVVCLVALLLVARGGGAIKSLTDAFIRFAELFLFVPLVGFFDNRLVARWFRRHPDARPGPTRLFLNWMIPLLAGGVFILLFILANPIIERIASNAWTEILSTFDWLPNFLHISRVFLWILTAIVSYGVLRFRRRTRPIQSITVPPRIPAPSMGHLLIIRCLVVFNLVFAVQTILDLVYLYGGATLPPGMTYAHYAHRGAYPLVVTALLAGLFVLLAFRTHGAAQRSRLARNLVYLWLAQNILLLISTVWRVWLYVNVYSLTRLRLAAIIWIVLVALGFGWLIWKIVAHKSGAWLRVANASTLFAVLYVCAFFNFPGFIADFNVRHCREIDGQGAPLDIAYLHELGPAALPALDWIRPHLAPQRQGAIAAAELDLHQSLITQMIDWQSWTYRRARILAAVPQTPPVQGGFHASTPHRSFVR